VDIATAEAARQKNQTTSDNLLTICTAIFRNSHWRQSLHFIQ